MKRILLFCALMACMIISCENKAIPPEGKTEPSSVSKVVVEKEKGEKEPPLPPEVKIKLKKDGKDNFSWELSGSDVDQILKVNEKLRKKLGGEQSR